MLDQDSRGWTLRVVPSRGWECDGAGAVTSSVLMMSLEIKSRMLRGVEGLDSFVCRNFIQGGSSVATAPCWNSREFSVYKAVKVQKDFNDVANCNAQDLSRGSKIQQLYYYQLLCR